MKTLPLLCFALSLKLMSIICCPNLILSCPISSLPPEDFCQPRATAKLFFKKYLSESETQCAAVSTVQLFISVPPQKVSFVFLSLRLTCHGNSPCDDAFPKTIGECAKLVSYIGVSGSYTVLLAKKVKLWVWYPPPFKINSTNAF